MSHTLDALIVGAGPVGLSAAISLAHASSKNNPINIRIIDKNTKPSSLSKAFAVHARTLRIFNQFGLDSAFISQGQKNERIMIYEAHQKRLEISFKNLQHNTLYPYILTIPQAMTEHILRDHLLSLGITVEWGVELIAIKQQASQIDVRVNTASQEAAFSTQWLLGCDGAHSTVRDLLGIQFSGDTYPISWWLADAEVNIQEENSIQGFLFKHELAALFPYGKQRVRMISSAPHDNKPTVQECQQLLHRVSAQPLQLSHATWLGVFKIHHKIAASYQEERVFLCGDAAHIHSPVGGQGMNTGIQDAYNLAWKLARVHNKANTAQLLTSYAIERRPAAQNVVATTDKMTQIITTSSTLATFARRIVMKLINALPFIQHRVALKVAELDIHYRKSPLTKKSTHGKLHAGDLAPNDWMTDLTTHEKTTLNNVVAGSNDHLLIFIQNHTASSYSSILTHAQTLSDQPTTIHIITTEQPATQSILAHVLLDHNGTLHKKYFATKKTTYCLVRPDGYIKAISTDLSKLY